MRVIHLLRHAKSSWDEDGDDFDRPLNARGRKAARAMGKHLRDQGIRPQLVLCSAAKRTRETLDRIGPALDGADISIEKGLYETTDARLLARLRALPDAMTTILLIGHNPGLERLAAKLCGGGDAAALDRMREKFPTGTLATLTTGLPTWAELKPKSCRLEALVRPADLG